jgi:peptidoglycan-associated lipoprotein
MVRKGSGISAGVVCVLVVALGGCTDYVKKTDYDAAISELRSNDQKQQQEIDAITQEMHAKFAKYDAAIAEGQGRIRVDTIAHFDTNQSTLREQDKPLLDEYAKVMKEHHTGAVITAEGFGDPDGAAAYNHRLGLKRAEAVRNYLINTGGLSASQVRAVSYGEAKDRAVVPETGGDKGLANRRVTLVIDFAGNDSGTTNSG